MTRVRKWLPLIGLAAVLHSLGVALACSSEDEAAPGAADAGSDAADAAPWPDAAVDSGDAAPGLAIATDSLPDGEQDKAYTTNLSATGGAGNLSWRVASGSLPAGLSLDPAGSGLTTTIAGTPSVGGSFVFTVEVNDASGASASKQLSLTVRGTSLLVYRADKDSAGTSELYAVELKNGSVGTTYKINQTLVAGGNVVGNPSASDFSPDGRWLLYRADQELDGTTELYAYDLSAAAPMAVKVNGALVAGGDVNSRSWSSGVSRLAYRADAAADAVQEVYIVDMSGAQPGSATKANAGLVLGGSVSDFAWAPNGNALLYRADQDVDGQTELFALRVNGATPGAVRRVNAGLPSGSSVTTYAWSPSSTALAYAADQTTPGKVELYWVDMTAGQPGSPIRLNSNLSAAGSVTGFAWAPGGAQLAFLADTQADGARDLFVVDSSGLTPSAPRRVNLPLEPGRSVAWLSWLDGTRILYAVDQDVDDQLALYLAPVQGGVPGPARPLSTLPASSAGVLTSGNLAPAASFDKHWLSYAADQDTAGLTELYVTDLTAATSTPKRANVALASGNTLSISAWSSTQSRLAYFTKDASDENALFVVPLSPQGPGAAQIVSPTLMSGTTILPSAQPWSGDGEWLAYAADLDSVGQRQLFVADLSAATPAAPQDVSGTLTPGSSGVSGYFWSR